MITAWLISVALSPPAMDAEDAAAKAVAFAKKAGYRERLELNHASEGNSDQWRPGTSGKMWIIGLSRKGGGSISANVERDGSVSYFTAQGFPARPWGSKKFSKADAERFAWSFMRSVPHQGQLKIDQIGSTSDGSSAAQFHLLRHRRRFYNLNPTYGYYMRFDLANRRVVWFGGREDLPQVNGNRARVDTKQAHDRFIKYAMEPGQYDSVISLLSPKWPTKMRLRPELGYYKWKHEPKARLVYRGVVEPENFKGPGTHSALKAFVDAQTGELLIPDDPGMG